jgi:hypothetical protein
MSEYAFFGWRRRRPPGSSQPSGGKRHRPPAHTLEKVERARMSCASASSRTGSNALRLFATGGHPQRLASRQQVDDANAQEPGNELQLPERPTWLTKGLYQKLDKNWSVSMKAEEVPAGSTIILGSPTQPMDTKVAAMIVTIIVSIVEITEAHLPQCFIVGMMAEAAQVLMIVVNTADSKSSAVERLLTDLGQILPLGFKLDIFTLPPDGTLLDQVRRAGCQIVPAIPRKPWWKFWK